MANRLKADERRGRIIAAARELFSARGYDDTRVEEIAEAAGCTTGPAYHFFGTKRDIFRAALRACIRDAAASMALVRTAEGNRTALERLIQSCDYLLGLLSIREVSSFMLEAPRVLGIEEYRDTVDRSLLAFVETDVRDAMSNGEIESEPPEPLAVFITGAIVTSANHIVLAEPPGSVDVQLEQYREALERMLLRLRVD